LQKLLTRIEVLRQKLHQEVASKGIKHLDVLKVSQQLDSALNEYYQISENSLCA
jgi:hypothetical protein